MIDAAIPSHSGILMAGKSLSTKEVVGDVVPEPGRRPSRTPGIPPHKRHFVAFGAKTRAHAQAHVRNAGDGFTSSATMADPSGWTKSVGLGLGTHVLTEG